MALIGDFSDTPFADLIQLYAGSGQAVSVAVTLGDGDEGVFYVENGDVVDARLGEASGRDAVRRALRLESGAFVVELNVRPTERTIHMPWRQLLMEEVVRMDEERRKGASDARRGASGALPLPGAGAAKAQAASGRTPRPAPLVGATTSSTTTVTGSTPSRPPPIPGKPAGAPAASAAPAASVPFATASRSSKRPLLVGAAAAAAVIVGAAAFFAFREKPAGAGEATAGALPVAQAAATLTGANVVRFGMVSPLSGPEKELGRSMKAGVELAFAAANEAGGVHGRKLALIALDDGNEPARTSEAMKELVEAKQVFAVVGNAGTATAAAALPVAVINKVPFIGAIGGGLRKDPPDPGVFVYRPGLAEETAAAVRYLVEVRRVDPADIAFFGQDDAFGEAGWTGATAQLKSYGRDPAQVVRTTYRRNSADVEAAVDRLRKVANLKGVVMVASSRAGARLVEKVLAGAPNVIFTDASTVDAAQLADDLVASRVGQADNVVVTQVVPLPTSRSSAVMKYRQLLEKHALGEAPSAISMEGYVVGTLVVKALEAAGPGADPTKLVAALEGMHGLDIGMGVPLGFSQTDHQASHKVWGTMLDKSGGWKQVDLE